jgi:hypothetical protein
MLMLIPDAAPRALAGLVGAVAIGGVAVDNRDAKQNAPPA